MKCPLCKQDMLTAGSGEYMDYFCRVRIKFEGKTSLPHCEKRDNKDLVWYLPPYQIVTKEKQTIVNVVDEANSGAGRFTKPDFKHVFTVDEIIHPDNPEKLVKRIKLLTLFS